MREKSDRVRLLHILESARLIAEWVRDIEKEEFFADKKLQEAVIRRIEVIGNTQATRAMQNVLFWLSAVTPERPGQPLKPKIDTMIEAMRAEGHRRDKNIQKLKRILNSLQESGVVAWWKFDGDYCVIMKKRDQEILEKKRKKKAHVPGNSQDNQTVVH
ncbi:MAG: hypothetical protein K6U04_15120 [Armatimonadetes bacterium]|nr:hypothetical protein [Armatimonadota bacterium]